MKRMYGLLPTTCCLLNELPSQNQFLSILVSSVPLYSLYFYPSYTDSDSYRDWSSRPRRPDYREYRGGGGGGRDRYSPARSQDMGPPMKRMRFEWDDRPRYGHDYYGSRGEGGGGGGGGSGGGGGGAATAAGGGGGGGGGSSWSPDHYPPPHHGNHHYGNHSNSSRFVCFVMS